MSDIETRIHRMIVLHQALMIAYSKLLNSVEGKGIFELYQYVLDDPIPYLKNKNIGFYERFQILGFSINYYWDFRTLYYLIKILFIRLLQKKKDHPKLRLNIYSKTFRPLISFFIKTHIHRQLDNLYTLYMQEIVTQNEITRNKEEIDDLRNRASDIKNLAETLPKTRRFLATFAAIGLGITTVVEFFNLNSLALEKIHHVIPSGHTAVILGFLLANFIAVIILRPFITAFQNKRALFLQTASYYDFMDHFIINNNQLYANSIYKLENDLYESLGHVHQKLREIPIDKIILLIVAGSLFVFLTSVMFTILLPSTHTLHLIDIVEIVIIFSLLAVYLFGVPLLEYRRRITHRLV